MQGVIELDCVSVILRGKKGEILCFEPLKMWMFLIYLLLCDSNLNIMGCGQKRDVQDVVLGFWKHRSITLMLVPANQSPALSDLGTTSMLRAYWLSDSDELLRCWNLASNDETFETRYCQGDSIVAIKVLRLDTQHIWSTLFTIFRHFLEQTTNQLMEKVTANENNH